MQISGTTNNSALQTLQSLLNSLETTGISTANSSAGAGQNVQGGQTASLIAGPLPSPPAASSLSNQFSPASLAFLTSLQASNSVSASTAGAPAGSISVSGLNQGLSDLTSALQEIQTALTGSTQTQSTGSTGAASLTGASATSTASASSTSLTSSATATLLSELNAVLNGLESAATPSSQHTHHHHHRTESAASGSTSTSSSSNAATTTGATDTTANNTATS